jgi:beta-glucosidase
MSVPPDFWWGTAASSTQSEGAAPASTWARWEDLGRAPRSGEGNAFATNYARDFAMYAEHGLTHHRLSIEWARIEPHDGRRDPAAIEHYTEMLRAARDAGIDIWVCLHHFSLPGWFADDEGGFLDDHARTYHWPRHVDFMGETFGDLVFGWMPVNEPIAYAFGGWVVGEFPPGKTDPLGFPKALRASHLANLEAWKLLRSGDQPVATVMNVSPVYPAVRSREPDERDAATAVAAMYDAAFFTCWTRALRDGILAIPGLPEEEIEDFQGAFDHIGFSYYSAWSAYADLSLGPYPADARVGMQGYAPWAEGLGVVIRRLHDELPGRSFIVAECGVGTDHADPQQDEWRVEVLRDSLVEVERCLDDGIDVRGLFHWTGVDNYEWTYGYTMDFGLFDRDRKPKPSALLARDWALRTGSR